MLVSMFDPELAREPIRRLSRHEYDRLVELGMFEDERLELLRGVLVSMSPQNWPHATMVAWLGRRLTLDLGELFMVRQQLPFAATEDSEPEPDLTVNHDEPGRRSHPSIALLVVEVADSSLHRDRRVKTPIYAEAGVPEYWIVDIEGRSVDVLTDPEREGYRSTQRLGCGDLLRPISLPRIEIAVADLPWP